MTNLNLLSIFWEVAKTKNITRASENLYVSQPAVSASIKELEKLYGKQLFIRKNKGIELNYFGQKLFDKINSSMKTLSFIDNQLTTFDKQQKGYIRIGTNTSNLNKLIADEMTKFITVFPDAELSVLKLTEKEIIEKSKNGDLDIVFLDGDFNSSVFEELNHLTIEYKIIGNKKYYDKYKSKPITLSDFEKENLILSNKSYTSRKNIDNFFDKHNITLSPKYELDGYSYITDFLLQGSAISILNPFYYLNHIINNELYIIPSSFSIDKRDIHLLKPLNSNSDNVCKCFIEQLKNINFDPILYH